MAIPWELFLASTLTLMVWSLLYKDNIFFDLAQKIYVGLIIGFYLYQFTLTLYGSVLIPLVKGNLTYLFVLFFGVLVLTTLSKKYMYFSRWAMALMSGIGVGIAIRGGIYPSVINQIKTLTQPIIVSSPIDSINNILIIIGTLTSIAYFFFTVKQTQYSLFTSKIGRLFLMALLGSGFAGSIIENMSFVISLQMDLSKDVGWWPVPIAIILIAFDVIRNNRKSILK
jgi:uncharacterized protein YhhL (DUF1145 family)